MKRKMSVFVKYLPVEGRKAERKRKGGRRSKTKTATLSLSPLNVGRPLSSLALSRNLDRQHAVQQLLVLLPPLPQNELLVSPVLGLVVVPRQVLLAVPRLGGLEEEEEEGRADADAEEVPGILSVLGVEDPDLAVGVGLSAGYGRDSVSDGHVHCVGEEEEEAARGLDADAGGSVVEEDEHVCAVDAGVDVDGDGSCHELEGLDEEDAEGEEVGASEVLGIGLRGEELGDAGVDENEEDGGADH